MKMNGGNSTFAVNALDPDDLGGQGGALKLHMSEAKHELNRE